MNTDIKSCRVCFQCGGSLSGGIGSIDVIGKPITRADGWYDIEERLFHNKCRDEYLEDSEPGPVPPPISVVFFSNGLAAVCDNRGQQIGFYQRGKHQDVIARLVQYGYELKNLEVTGSPIT
jgi:hypothetical protein